MTVEQAHKMIEASLANLSEHFEAVEILASYPSPEGGTRCVKRGCGNWYARQGMAHEFIGSERAVEIAEELNRNESD